jgi:hypothetical protein
MPFIAPQFDILRDSATEWRARAEESFRKHCDAALLRVAETTKDLVSKGILTKVERPNPDFSPHSVCEWGAAQKPIFPNS